MSAHTYELTWRHTTQKLTVLSVRPLRITGFLYAYLKKKITFIFKCWKHKNSGIKFSKVNYKKNLEIAYFSQALIPLFFSFFCNKSGKRKKKLITRVLTWCHFPVVMMRYYRLFCSLERKIITIKSLWFLRGFIAIYVVKHRLCSWFIGEYLTALSVSINVQNLRRTILIRKKKLN